MTVIEKKRIEYITIGVLVVVALFIVLSRLGNEDKGYKVSSTRGVIDKEWKGLEMFIASIPKKEGVEYTATKKRIPFEGPLEAGKRPTVVDENIILPRLALQGMIWNSMKPQTVINNKIYGVNDMISAGEYKIEIKDITRSGVHLEYRGKEFIVRPRSTIR